jgi:hypothetical protein
VASPDIKKQGFLAVVFYNREYNGKPDPQGNAKQGKAELSEAKKLTEKEK